MNDVLADKLDRLPKSCGVYLMYDSVGKIIYIGKAKILKNRVKQYFGSTLKHEKVQNMVAEVTDLDYIITNSEIDALSLESNLIKKHLPKFNILLRDDKRAPFIRVDVKDAYPKFSITRKIKSDGAKYFGPYFFGVRVADVLSVLKIAYRIRTCDRSMHKISRACLDYHIKQCIAPCERFCTQEEYSHAVQQAILFLQGREDSARCILQGMMEISVANEDFEKAILYRDKIAMLDNLARKNIAELNRDVNIDCIAIASDGIYSVVSVLIVRNGKAMGMKNFAIIDASIVVQDSLATTLYQYYDTNRDIPDEIATRVHLDSSVEDFVSGLARRKIVLSVPQRGVKSQLLQMAQSNADDYLIKSRSKEEIRYNMTVGAVCQLQNILSIKSARRMECYDISNTSGTDIVASQAVFIDGKPAKNHYRKYKIKTVQGSDDFASIHETLLRRFERAKNKDARFEELPDLVVIDGGKGQLSAALEALNNVGYGHIKIISLAKREEEVFLPNQSEPILLSKDNNALKLLQRIRDEAHRFAVTYHRKLRDKRILSKSKSCK